MSVSRYIAITSALLRSCSNRFAILNSTLSVTPAVFALALASLMRCGLMSTPKPRAPRFGRRHHHPAVAAAEIDHVVAGLDVGELQHPVDHLLRRRHIDHVEARFGLRKGGGNAEPGDKHSRISCLAKRYETRIHRKLPVGGFLADRTSSTLRYGNTGYTRIVPSAQDRAFQREWQASSKGYRRTPRLEMPPMLSQAGYEPHPRTTRRQPDDQPDRLLLEPASCRPR